MEKRTYIPYIDTASFIILGILFLVFPLMITSLTTDPFILPKQALLGIAVFAVLLLQGAKMVIERGVKIRRTPFDIPVLTFTAVVLISALLATNKIDAITAFVPFLLSVLAYFLIVNTTKERNNVLFLQTALLSGAVLASILMLFSTFNIFVLPFEFSKNTFFSPLGSILDQAIYLALVLPLAAYPLLKKDANDLKDIRGGKITLGIVTGLIAIGIALSLYTLAVRQKPVLLPFETGFRTAFASISQDTGRVAQGFFFGSGYGTYGTDFTRFKPDSFNTNSTLWGITFYKSSSFVLELMATVGILGVISFLFLIYTILKQKPIFVSLVMAIVGLFLLPFSFVNLTLFFLLLGLFAASQGLKHHNKYFDVELELVALKKGTSLLRASHRTQKEKRYSILDNSRNYRSMCIIFRIL